MRLRHFLVALPFALEVNVHGLKHQWMFPAIGIALVVGYFFLPRLILDLRRQEGLD